VNVVTEVEVSGEHRDDWFESLGRRREDVHEDLRYYRFTFSDRAPLARDLAATIGVPVGVPPEDAARAFAASSGFVESMRPGTIRLRRRTITTSDWEGLS
jgi:hypothetical protein